MLISTIEELIIGIDALKTEYESMGFEFKCLPYKNSYCIYYNNGGPLSRTEMTFNIHPDCIELNHLRVNLSRRNRKISLQLLEPLFNFYIQNKLNFNYVSVLSTNDGFWLHILKKYPQIEFKIGWYHDSIYSGPEADFIRVRTIP